MLRTRLTFANVVSVLALFIALGGSSYAALKVTGEDVKNSSLTGADVKDNTLTGADVKRRSLRATDFKKGELPKGPKGDPGPSTGPAGGDLTGSYPNPRLAPGSVTPGAFGVTPAVATLNLTAETTTTTVDKTLHANFELYDTAGLHDIVSATEDLVAPVAGTYIVSATVDWDANSAGYRRTTLEASTGSQFASVAGPPLPAPAVTTQHVTGIERLTAGQSVHVRVLQGSGGNLGVRINRFEMAFVGG